MKKKVFRERYYGANVIEIKAIKDYNKNKSKGKMKNAKSDK